MREELDKEQASYKLSGECCDENESLATWSSGSRGWSGRSLGEDICHYDPNELAAGASRGKSEEGSGGHGAYGARKEGMRRQVGNRGESKDRCGSPPRHTPPPLAESDHDSHAWALGSNPESPMALVGTT